mmetsp:Transcript_76414/g.213583  ORF Transcript_76414/g.213583 Transcript_76414/m.213583 type:complete len:596 (+) Transcript_76414:291-2078(+)
MTMKTALQLRKHGLACQESMRYMPHVLTMRLRASEPHRSFELVFIPHLFAKIFCLLHLRAGTRASDQHVHVARYRAEHRCPRRLSSRRGGGTRRRQGPCKDNLLPGKTRPGLRLRLRLGPALWLRLGPPLLEHGLDLRIRGNVCRGLALLVRDIDRGPLVQQEADDAFVTRGGRLVKRGPPLGRVRRDNKGLLVDHALHRVPVVVLGEIQKRVLVGLRDGACLGLGLRLCLGWGLGLGLRLRWGFGLGFGLSLGRGLRLNGPGLLVLVLRDLAGLLVLGVDRVVDLKEHVGARLDHTVGGGGLHEQAVTLEDVLGAHVHLSRGPPQGIPALLPPDREIVAGQVLQQHLLAGLDLLLAGHGVEPTADPPRHPVLVAELLERRLVILWREDQIIAPSSSVGDAAVTLDLEREGLYLVAARGPLSLELLHLTVPVEKHLERYAPRLIRELPVPLRGMALGASIRHIDPILPSRRVLPENVLDWLQGEALARVPDVHVDVEVPPGGLLVAVEYVLRVGLPVPLDAGVQVQVAGVVPDEGGRDGARLRALPREPGLQGLQVQGQGHPCVLGGSHPRRGGWLGSRARSAGAPPPPAKCGQA